VTESASVQAPPPAIVLQGLGRRYGDVVALDGITLTVPSGTLLGVIGPSGAGKTTAVRILTGGLRATSGVARVLGEDPQRFRRRTRERIGYMPQLFSLYPDLTAGENVDFVATLFGMLFFRRRRRVRAVLELVDLWRERGRRASELSGGMQRRLELACALVHDPAVLFLDEPTAGLDPLLRRTIWMELHRLRDSGRTIVLTTQYVGEAEEGDFAAVATDTAALREQVSSLRDTLAAPGAAAAESMAAWLVPAALLLVIWLATPALASLVAGVWILRAASRESRSSSP
jgi:ABC-2 type transport system ATP-binding protein